nr:hypothetical protein [Tanacetum cinerariifolium]
MVAILEKSEHNVDFHLIVEFIEASPLRYALSVKPTVYVSQIRQFWSTARIETTKEGTKILATVDELEDITYSDDEDDVGAKANFNNLETSIAVSPIPTTRVHKDHPVTQIIG